MRGAVAESLCVWLSGSPERVWTALGSLSAAWCLGTPQLPVRLLLVLRGVTSRLLGTQHTRIVCGHCAAGCVGALLSQAARLVWHGCVRPQEAAAAVLG